MAVTENKNLEKWAGLSKGPGNGNYKNQITRTKLAYRQAGLSAVADKIQIRILKSEIRK